MGVATAASATETRGGAAAAMRTATPARGIFGSRRNPSPQRDVPACVPEPLVGEAEGEQGFVIAHRISGERALPVAGRMVLLSQARLCRHVLVCGATGSGKTETVLRLAWTVAKQSDASD